MTSESPPRRKNRQPGDIGVERKKETGSRVTRLKNRKKERRNLVSWLEIGRNNKEELRWREWKQEKETGRRVTLMDTGRDKQVGGFYE